MTASRPGNDPAHEPGAYDAIVVGAGVNGLSLAAHLANAGLRTIVLERKPNVGGQAATSEPLGPGFVVHPHANYLSFQELLASRDSAVSAAMDVPTVTPVAQHGLAFRDGRPPVVLYRIDHQRETRSSLGVYSRRDAEAYERCKSVADGLTSHLTALYFAPPRRRSFINYLNELKRAMRGIVDVSQLGSGSACSVIDELFETNEVRTLFYLLAAEFSGDPREPGSDISFLGHVCWILGRRALPVGGMGTVPRSLAESAAAAGAEIRLGAEVKRIRVTDGTVRGVTLADGAEIMAPVVASSTAHDHYMRDLLGADQLSPATRRSWSQFQHTPADIIGSYAAALTEPPCYLSGRHNPDIDRCAQTFVGLDNTNEALNSLAVLRAGGLPPVSGAVRVNTLWDASQAPAGTHVAGADSIFPGTLNSDWLARVRQGFPAGFAAIWSQYAPNVAHAIQTHWLSLDPTVNRKLAIREGEAQYRGDVRGLYECGSSTHPGGGVHTACAANAFEVMMSDGLVTPTRHDPGSP